MNLKNPRLLVILSIAAAWLFDFLFWNKQPGISFMVFVIAAAAGGLSLAWQEGRRPALTSLWLLLPVGLFSVFAWLRREPLTTFVNYILALSSLALLAITLLGGRWISYTLSDYLAGFFRLAVSAIGRPGSVWLNNRRMADPDAQAAVPDRTQDPKFEPGDADTSEGGLPPHEKELANPQPIPVQVQAVKAARKTRSYTPVLRGLVLAFPIVTLLAALLAAADPVFEQSISAFLDLFRIERLAEYLFRAFYILVLAYILAGVYLHGLFASRDEHLAHEANQGRGWLPSFLGFTEAGIVLGAVDLLFAAFVAVQFRYFFGGQANIHLEGFTYSEYARRGFGELVAVSLISLLLFQVLSAVTHRKSARQRWAFSGLSVALVALVVVILVSAFQRLLLYENAYGFTRLRGYTHLFIIWLGVLLAATAVLEVAGRQRAFALAAVLTAFGFGLSLNLVSIDQLIVRQNIARAQAGEELDMATLASLSEDSVPALVHTFQDSTLPESIRARVAGALLCREAPYRDGGFAFYAPGPWQSFNYSRYQAGVLMDQVRPSMQEYQPVFHETDQIYSVEFDGVSVPCLNVNRDWMD